MVSYFDHFIITQISIPFINDFSILLLICLITYKIILSKNKLNFKKFDFSSLLISHWIEVVKENLGLKYIRYSYLIISIFFLILSLNIRAYFTYIIPGSSHISITFGLAITIWLGIIVYGFFIHKSLFFSILMPNGAPLILSPFLVIIEIISNLSRPIALGMRLAANITAGHILMNILIDFSCKLLFFSYLYIGFFPLCIIIFMFFLESAVLFIQAYVFTLLVMIYLKDSLELH